MLIRRDYRNWYRIIYSLCLENGVTMTPKRRLLTLIFACLCFKKSLLINSILVCIISFCLRVKCEKTILSRQWYFWFRGRRFHAVESSCFTPDRVDHKSFPFLNPHLVIKDFGWNFVASLSYFGVLYNPQLFAFLAQKVKVWIPPLIAECGKTLRHKLTEQKWKKWMTRLLSKSSNRAFMQ